MESSTGGGGYRYPTVMNMMVAEGGGYGSGMSTTSGGEVENEVEK